MTNTTPINFQPIFDYMDQKELDILDKVESKVKTIIQEEIGELKTSIANLAGSVKVFQDEMLVSGHRTSRLE